VRVLAAFPLLVAAAVAAPGERELIARWADAEPGERLLLRRRIESMGRERRFVEARCVLVPFRGRRYTLAELFGEILEPALSTPPPDRERPGNGGEEDPPIHDLAIGALEALRGVHRAPAPVGPATLNLLLAYARDALDAWRLPPRLRLRIFSEVLKNVRDLEDRVAPDARTGWILEQGILPSLFGTARRFRHDEKVVEQVSEAASLLSMPSVLDAGTQARIASLVRGADTRAMLQRAYRRGQLDDLGVAALARSVVAQGSDDDAYVAGAAPLLLELLGDRNVLPAMRGRIVDLVIERMAPVAPLRSAAVELLAAAYGEPPRSLDQSIARRKENPGPVPRPEGGETYRFLQVVLLRADPGAPPEPVRVVRRDVRFHEPIRAAGSEFVGVLVPAAGGRHADFLGPSPGLRGVPDNRLLRRTLVLERIAIRTFGARAEEIELCVALPRDASEPVPADGARLSHVLDLIRGRLERTQDAGENAALADLLVRIGTPAARAMAIRFARGADDATSLLALLEKGDASAAQPLLDRIGALDDAERERAFAALLALRDDGVAALPGRVHRWRGGTHRPGE